MTDLVYIGNAVLVDTTPIDLADEAPRHWSPRGAKWKVYPYVQFPNLERVVFGLFLTEHDPAATHDKWIDHIVVGRDKFFEPISRLMDVRDAKEALSKHKALIEESPFAEIEEEKDYLRLLAISMGEDLGDDPDQWPAEAKARVQEESHWDGPAVYDLRDFSVQAKDAREYELSDMKFHGDNVLEGMFQGDEWRGDLHSLLERNG